MDPRAPVERRRSGIHLFDIAGIQIRIDYSWFIIFLLVVWSLSAGYFPARYPGETASSYWLAGLVATLLFFASVLIHELAHALVAIRAGIEIPEITLFLFGGVSRLSEDPKDPRTELKVAAVGPLASFAIAGTFWLVRSWVGTEPQLVFAVVSYLAFINLAVGIFNLVPGFPLDGGRIFRAIWWWRTGSLTKATRTASDMGKGFALVLMFLGALEIFAGALLGGLWLIFIGMFLRGVAQASFQELISREILDEMRVEDLELEKAVSVGPDMNLKELVNDYFLRHGYHSFPVSRKGDVVGVITLSGVKEVPESERDRRTVSDTMEPLRDEHIIRPDTSLGDVLGKFRSGVQRLLVMERGELKGVMTHRELLRLLEVHKALAE